MLVLRGSVYEAILAHAREASPAEACGLLGGRREPAGTPETDEVPPPVATATAGRRATNVAADPDITYEIDPEEQFSLMEDLEAAGLDLVGFYHSHPRGPEGPSTTDHARATWPGYHYLIASLGGDPPSLDAWVWDGETFVRDGVTVE